MFIMPLTLSKSCEAFTDPINIQCMFIETYYGLDSILFFRNKTMNKSEKKMSINHGDDGMFICIGNEKNLLIRKRK